MKITNCLVFVFCITLIACESKRTFIKNTWQAYDSFNKVFLDYNKYIYKTSSSYNEAKDRWNGAAAIWCQPIFWDMAMNAYKLALKTGDDKQIKELLKLNKKIFEGNKKQYVSFDFNDCNENTGWFIYDDIQWWTITLARAYLLFGNDEYLLLSEKSFDRVWNGSSIVGDTGSYDKKYGGMFWRWYPIQNPIANNSELDGKMACINFPTVIAAMTLYDCICMENSDKYSHEKEEYLEKAIEIYDWGIKNLFDKCNGKVADSRHGVKVGPDWTSHVYNQATFIGASVLLYRGTGDNKYLDNAILAADYTIETMSDNNVLPFENGIEQGIYTTIFAQYMAMLVYDCGQKQYIPFLKYNIEKGWNNRDKKRNICKGRYGEKVTSNDTIDVYSASGIPALMLLFNND